MDDGAGTTRARGWRALRGPVLGLAVVALLALVAVASRRGAVGGGDGEAQRRVPETALDYVVSGFLAALVLGTLVIASLLFVEREALVEARLSRSRKRRNVRSVVVFVGIMLVLALLLQSLRGDQGGNARLPEALEQLTDERRQRPEDRAYEPRFKWEAVGIVGAVAFASLAALVAFNRRYRRTARTPSDALAHSLSSALDESLDDLRRESDPRRAVVAAYARMERVLAAHGVPRRAAEAPLEYLARVLRDVALRESSVRTLTHLFERAKFSHHAVDPTMKEAAIDALETARAELRAVT